MRAAQAISSHSAQPLSLAPPQLDPALWDAFEQRLLYHIYHDELPGALDLGDVLQLAQLADRFQVGRRVACRAAGPVRGISRRLS